MPDRDTRRRFGRRERAALLLAAGGCCTECGAPLDPDFHADHREPWARGGRTDVINGQALCPTCNRRKSDKPAVTPPPRRGQPGCERPDGGSCRRRSRAAQSRVRARPAVAGDARRTSATGDQMSATNNTKPPRRGGGAWPDDRKLRAWQGRALRAINRSRDELPARSLPRRRQDDTRAPRRPRAPSRPSRAASARSRPDGAARRPVGEGGRAWSGSDSSRTGPGSGCRGTATGSRSPTSGSRRCPSSTGSRAPNSRRSCSRTSRTTWGTAAAWGRAYKLATEPAAFRLLLSGTPFRSDNDPIPGVKYDEDGRATPDFAYTYPEAIRGRICRKIAFVNCDGELRWADHGT